VRRHVLAHIEPLHCTAHDRIHVVRHAAECTCCVQQMCELLQESGAAPQPQLGCDPPSGSVLISQPLRVTVAWRCFVGGRGARSRLARTGPAGHLWLQSETSTVDTHTDGRRRAFGTSVAAGANGNRHVFPLAHAARTGSGCTGIMM
jgi:hypothetical protein